MAVLLRESEWNSPQEASRNDVRFHKEVWGGDAVIFRWGWGDYGNGVKGRKLLVMPRLCGARCSQEARRASEMEESESDDQRGGLF